MRALVVGATRLGRVLAHDLLHAGNDVRVLDDDHARLARLPTILEGHAIHGAPLERDVLEGAVTRCDGIVAVSDDDALNAVVAIAARRELHVPVAAAVVGNPARAQARTGLGVHVVCPTARTAHELALTLARSGVESVHQLAGETAVYRAELPARLSGRALAELEQPGELVAVAVERDGHVLLARPDLALREGDVLHVAASHRRLVTDLIHP